MNVASKDLCEELYKLSGWNDTHFGSIADGSKEHIVYDRYAGGWLKNEHPVYDLAYLLRKIPGAPSVYRRKTGREEWRAHTTAHRGYKADADTPEDALAKLVIELFKQGILK